MGDVVPSSYIEALAAAKTAIQSARARTVLAVNSELIHLYWTLGRLIVDRQEADGWDRRSSNAWRQTYGASSPR